jgi:hypothetical protein
VGDLRSAFSGGMLGTETFELRVGHALAARTRRALRALVADLPVPPWRRAFGAVRDTLLGDYETPLLRLHPPPDIEVGLALVVGRDDGVNLFVDDPAVSRRHVMLRRDADGWTAQDLHSTNGTYVNGWRIERAHLKPGDELQVGDTRLRITG